MDDGFQLPAGYPELLQELKWRIGTAQVRAAFAVSRELVLLYRSIGQDLSRRFGREGWGTKINERLLETCRPLFPVWRGLVLEPPVHADVRGGMAGAGNFATACCQIAWGDNLQVLDRLGDPATREWYLRAALEYGWSRNILVLQIKSGLHEREGRALTNFERVLPPLDSDLARQVLKDPYNFDFLSASKQAHERDIERGLLTHLRDLLLELGRGFSFVGSQVPLRVADETFYLDLLFYHIRLHRFVVIELKTGKFQPEWTGKLAFYLAAVNGTMRTPVEGPSIGILLCESRTGPIVEFALENINQPIGVSTDQITRDLPVPVREELPSVENLQEVVVRLRAEIDAAQEGPHDES